MRSFALLALALAACSSDPVPQDASAADTGILDTGPVGADAGLDMLDGSAADTSTTDRGVLDTGPADVGHDIPATDQPTPDIGVDATSLDASDGARDVPLDLGGDIGTDVISDARTGDAMIDLGASDVGHDVAVDVRVACSPGPEPSCRTHADCAMCFPASTGEPWCCRPNGFCGPRVGVFSCQ